VLTTEPPRGAPGDGRPTSLPLFFSSSLRPTCDEGVGTFVRVGADRAERSHELTQPTPNRGLRSCAYTPMQPCDFWTPHCGAPARSGTKMWSLMGFVQGEPGQLNWNATTESPSFAVTRLASPPHTVGLHSWICPPNPIVLIHRHYFGEEAGRVGSIRNTASADRGAAREVDGRRHLLT
jgi:hypothetical protein